MISNEVEERRTSGRFILEERRGAKRGRPRIERSVFPLELETERLQWMLMNTHVAHTRASIGVTCQVDVDEAARIIGWLSEMGQYITSRPNGQQQELHLGKYFAVWLEAKSVEHRLPQDSRFHVSLALARSKLGTNQKVRTQHRSRLIEMLEADSGKSGCIDCSTQQNLEFDHQLERGPKVALVSTLLQQKRWVEAEIEAKKCQLRCTSCHRKKTTLNKELPGRPRTPLGNAETEAKRTANRRSSATWRAKNRLRLSEVTIGKSCTLCKRLCTAENITEFEWDHYKGDKKRTIGSMLGSGDSRFYAELEKCRLLCTFPCHRDVTAHQAAAGVISKRIRENKQDVRKSI